MKPVDTGYSKEFLSGRKRITVISAIVIVVVTGFFGFTHIQTQGTVNVMWLQVHTEYRGNEHFFGPPIRYVQQDFHTIDANSTHTFSFTVTNTGTSSQLILEIAIHTHGFILVRSPNGLPYVVNPGRSTTVSFEVHVPAYDYAGNLNVTLFVS